MHETRLRPVEDIRAGAKSLCFSFDRRHLPPSAAARPFSPVGQAHLLRRAFVSAQFYDKGCENCTANGFTDEETEIRGNKENVQDATTQNFNGCDLLRREWVPAESRERLDEREGPDAAPSCQDDHPCEPSKVVVGSVAWSKCAPERCGPAQHLRLFYPHRRSLARASQRAALRRPRSACRSRGVCSLGERGAPRPHAVRCPPPRAAAPCLRACSRPPRLTPASRGQGRRGGVRRGKKSSAVRRRRRSSPQLDGPLVPPAVFCGGSSPRRMPRNATHAAADKRLLLRSSSGGSSLQAAKAARQQRSCGSAAAALINGSATRCNDTPECLYRLRISVACIATMSRNETNPNPSTSGSCRHNAIAWWEEAGAAAAHREVIAPSPHATEVQAVRAGGRGRDSPRAPL